MSGLAFTHGTPLLVAAGARDAAWLVLLYAQHLRREAPELIDAGSARQLDALVGAPDTIAPCRVVETVACAYATRLAGALYGATSRSRARSTSGSSAGVRALAARTSSGNLARAMRRDVATPRVSCAGPPGDAAECGPPDRGALGPGGLARAQSRRKRSISMTGLAEAAAAAASAAAKEAAVANVSMLRASPDGAEWQLASH
jgi:hypothetical protein